MRLHIAEGRYSNAIRKLGLAQEWIAAKERATAEALQSEQLAIDREAKDAAVSAAKSASRAIDAAERAAAAAERNAETAERAWKTSQAANTRALEESELAAEPP